MRLRLPGSCLVGEAAGEKKVSAVAGRHVHDVAGLAEVVDCLLENHFHEECSGRTVDRRVSYLVAPGPAGELAVRIRRRQSIHVSVTPSPTASGSDTGNNTTAAALAANCAPSVVWG